MGHTTSEKAAACRRRCGAIPTATILSVRDPYAYWASMFRYAWLGKRADFVSFYFSAYTTGARTIAQRRAGPLRSFVEFLRWVDREANRSPTCLGWASRCCPEARFSRYRARLPREG